MFYTTVVDIIKIVELGIKDHPLADYEPEEEDQTAFRLLPFAPPFPTATCKYGLPSKTGSRLLGLLIFSIGAIPSPPFD